MLWVSTIFLRSAGEHGILAADSLLHMNDLAFPSAELREFDCCVLQMGKLTQKGPPCLAQADSIALAQMGVSIQISQIPVLGIQRNL